MLTATKDVVTESAAQSLTIVDSEENSKTFTKIDTVTVTLIAIRAAVLRTSVQGITNNVTLCLTGQFSSAS